MRIFMPIRTSAFTKVVPIVMLMGLVGWSWHARQTPHTTHSPAQFHGFLGKDAYAQKSKPSQPAQVRNKPAKPRKAKTKATLKLKNGKVFKTPPKKWTWVDMPNTKCGYGPPTGIALNTYPKAKTLIIMLQGGGACWKKTGVIGGCFARMSFAFGLRGINERYFRRSWRIRRVMRSFVLQRNRAYNPFAKAHYAFIPYCTGDVHAGDATVSYGTGKVMHFHGHRNMKAYLSRLVPTFKNVKRVILAGVSAGAVGAALNWNMVQQAFGPKVKVDLLSDSGPLIKPIGNRWNQWLSAWKLKLPAGCPNCRKSMGQFIDHFRQTMFNRGRQAGFLLYRNDRIIRTFLGLYFGSRLFQARLSNMLYSLDHERNAQYFVISGSSHVLMFRRNAHRYRSPSGITLATWMKQFANRTKEWSSHRTK